MAGPSPSDYNLAPVHNDDGESTPKPPRPPAPPKPLPRISRSAPLTAAEAERQERETNPEERPPRRERPSRRDRRAAEAADDDEDRPLVEPTPVLDTVETRQRVRIILGVAALLAVGLAIAMIVRAVGGGPSEEEGLYVVESAQLFRPQQVVASTANSADADEGQARALLARARTATTIGIARGQLQRIVDSYPGSSVAADARNALDRLAEGQPPFADIPTLAPEGFTHAPSSPEPEATVDVPEPTPPPEPEPAPEPAPAPIARVLPPGFTPHPDSRMHPDGWPDRIVAEADGMTLILVPSGVYTLGRDGGAPAEGPAHRVQLPPYYLDEHEVTVDQFARYRDAMTRRGEPVEPSPEDLTRLGLTGRYPVVLATAREALRYADWAGRSLPTEAQWEAAARGPESLIRPWGAGPPPWSDRRAARQLDPVMAYPADRSPSGAFDLAANAWEWVADWYDADAFEGIASQVSYNPGGPPASSSTPPKQGVRGSSPTHETSHREGMRLDTRLPYLGFRCALNVEGVPLPNVPRRGAAPAPLGSNPPASGPPPANPKPPSSGTLVPF